MIFLLIPDTEPPFHLRVPGAASTPGHEAVSWLTLCSPPVPYFPRAWEESATSSMRPASTWRHWACSPRSRHGAGSLPVAMLDSRALNEHLQKGCSQLRQGRCLQVRTRVGCQVHSTVHILSSMSFVLAFCFSSGWWLFCAFLLHFLKRPVRAGSSPSRLRGPTRVLSSR